MRQLVLLLIFLLGAIQAEAACGWVIWKFSSEASGGEPQKIEFIIAFENYKECVAAAKALVEKDYTLFKKLDFKGVQKFNSAYSYRTGSKAYLIEMKCVPSDLDPRQKK